MIRKAAILLLMGLNLLVLSQAGWSQAPAPEITELFPNYAPAGFTTNIYGSGFGQQQGNSTVTFNGVPVTQISTWSDTTLTVTVPAGATTGNVIVTVGGVASNGVQFLVTTPTFFVLTSLNSTTSGLKQLSQTNAPPATFLGPDLVNQPAGEYMIQAFDTQAGVPGSSNTMFAGMPVSFYVWMHQTAGTPGTLFPDVKLYLNSPTGTPICSGIGNTALTTTNTEFGFGCTISADITLTPTDRYYLWVGVNSTAASTSSLQAQLNVGVQARGRPSSETIVPVK